MRRALNEFIVGGIRTNIPFHLHLLDDPEVQAGTMTTRTVERIMSQQSSANATAAAVRRRGESNRPE
jgi:biotin carboxylase